MAVSLIPLNTVRAETRYFLKEDFSGGIESWTASDSTAASEEDGYTFMRFEAGAAEEKKDTYRSIDTAIPSSSMVYMVELDARFADESSGVIELYSSSNLGPTIIFDGTSIKTKVGNPSSYVTMYSNAEVGKWYNIKLLANGKSSVYGFTKAEEDTEWQKTDKDIKRNLKNGVVNKIGVSNMINSETEYRGGAVDIRNIRISQPLADEVKTEEKNGLETIAVPASSETKTAQYRIKSLSVEGVPFESYSPIAQGLAYYSLYDADNENDLTSSLPKGIAFDASTGILSVAQTAEQGTYNVRLSNYDGSVYDSKKIELISPGELISLAFSKMPKRLPIPPEGEITSRAIAVGTDQYGSTLPFPDVTWSLCDSIGAEKEIEGVSISGDGKISVTSATEEGSVYIAARSAENPEICVISEEIPIYKMQETAIKVEGAKSLDPGDEAVYSAAVFDQYDTEIPNSNTGFEWSIATEHDGITMDNGTVKTNAASNAQTAVIYAEKNGLKGEMKMVVSNYGYTYKPIDGGFEIKNGDAVYTRPIYAPHMNDTLDGARYIYYAGDRPKLVLTDVIDNNDGNVRSYANIFFGIKTEDGNSKWLEDMDNITSRYVYGREEYDITDSSFEGTIRLVMTHSDKLDAMLVKAELPDGLTDKLVTAVGPQRRKIAVQPVGGNVGNANVDKLQFDRKATEGAQINTGGNKFNITNNSVDVNGTANVEMNFAVKDATAYSAGIDKLLETDAAGEPMLVGTSKGNDENTVYLMFTTEGTDNEYVEAYKTDAKEMFDSGVEYYRELSTTTVIDTPDPRLNSAFTAQTMALDGSWQNPSICHGPIGWHNAQGGWRCRYGFITAGWYDRVKTDIRLYIAHQDSNGKIWNYPNRVGRYQMNEVLIDELLYYWKWSGDNEFMTEAYDFVKGHLKYQDSEIAVPGTNLYENFLNAWNTDNKWTTGGAGTIATAYTWHAYDTMVDIAKTLGKEEDAATFKAKADAIKSEAKESLWDKDSGVYGEHRDYFGYKRLNAAPDLSSVYTPIDLGMTDYEEAHQMLRYTDYAIDSEYIDGYEFKWSSNRAPKFYSSYGLYEQEVLNNALAYFQTGEREKGYSQFMSNVIPMYIGTAAGPGAVSHVQSAKLTNAGHIDFGDTTGMFQRTVITGLFGIMMDQAHGRAEIKPGFPEDWNHASYSSDYISYSYSFKNNTDSFKLQTPAKLEYVLSVPARSARVKSVKVNGEETDYTLTETVNVTTPPLKEATVEIVYDDAALPELSYSQTAAANNSLTVSSNCKITAVSDPQGVLEGTDGCGTDTITLSLNEKTGYHTVFAEVEKDEMTRVLPVDIEIREPIEITDTKISGNGISLKLKNNTETALNISAKLQTISGSTDTAVSLVSGGESEEITVPLADGADLTPGNNAVTAKISGDITYETEAELEDWTIGAGNAKYKTINLENNVNQDLRTLHANTYDFSIKDDPRYGTNYSFRLPNFSFSSDAKHTVLPNGRSWWEPSKKSHSGDYGVPSSLTLPKSGEYMTDIGVPFEIASKDGHNAAFVSLYNQFPDRMNIPVGESGSKIYFMVSVSTNTAQAWVENARITVNMTDGTSEKLSLTCPENIDDWLCYQGDGAYNESGYAQFFGSKAHANILAVDFGEIKTIESVDFECISNEVLAGLLGITVAKPENAREETEKPSETGVGQVSYNDGRAVIPVTIAEGDSLDVNVYIAEYDKFGTLAAVVKHSEAVIETKDIVLEYSPESADNRVSVYVWDNDMKPLAENT